MAKDAKISPSDNEKDAEVQTKASFRQIFQFAESYDYLLIAIGTIHAVAGGAAAPFMMYLFGSILDELGQSGVSFYKQTVQMCFYFIYLGLGIFGVMSVATTCWSIVSQRQSMKIRKMYMKAVLRQDIGWFDKNKVTELPTKIITATNQIQEGTGKRVCDAIYFMTSSVGLYIIGFTLSWKMSLVIMAGFPIVIVAGAYLQIVTKERGESNDKHYASAGAIATEALSSIRTVFSLNGQKHELARYAEHLLTAERKGGISALKLGFGNGLMFGTFYLIYGLGFWFGSLLLSWDLEDGCTHSCITGGDIVTVLFSILFGSFTVGMAGPSITAITEAKSAGGRIFGTVNRVPEIDALSEEGQTLNNLVGNISIRAVEFAYPTRLEKPVYRSLSLEINAGESVALVGPSGEGKSTLVSLLLRFYDPQGGGIFLDNADIRSLKLNWYRSQLGYVGQEPVLFAGSISSNIKNGKTSASQEEIEAAAKQANAHDFILSFPEKYGTDVGEAGIQISGGQKQRIAIARALIKKPKVLLLDEATSALDNESERVVQEALDEIQKNSQFTTIVIAHRLTTIQHCDKIAVISGGQVAELGNHTELLTKEAGIYAKLASKGNVETQNETTPVEDEISTTVLEEEKSPNSPVATLSPMSPKYEKAQSNNDPSKPLVSENANDIESPDEKDDAKKQVGMKDLLGLASDRMVYLVLGCLGCVVVGGAMPAQGYLLAKAQDMFYQTDVKELRAEGRAWSLGFVVFSIVIFLGNLVRSWGLGVFQERVTTQIRQRCFKSMLSRAIPWFDREENATGALVERLSKDAAAVHVLAGGVLGSTLNTVFALLVGIGLAFFYSWEMSLGVLGVIPFMAVAGLIQQKAMAGGDDEASKDKSEGGGTITAAIQGIRTVHAFGMHHTVNETYGRQLEDSIPSNTKKLVINAALFAYGEAVPMLLYAWAFWLGAFLIERGRLSFEDMMISLFCLMCVGFAMGDAALVAGDQAAGKAAAISVFALLDSKEDLEPADGGATATETQGAIEFNNLKFAYPQRPNHLVYDGLSLSVPAGSTVALAGPSGGGKSTCMQLLLRFYTPLEGYITLDGKDIRDLNLNWLRSQIGYVSQEPVLFSGSIRSNVAYGMRNVSENDLIEAATVAKAHEFVNGFPKKYETDVGEKSMLLSGGQKQRLAIARAILKKPKVLLLDEATSALDNENEKLVQEALDNMQQQRRKNGSLTTLVIAHRLSTIQNADQIAVIQSGKVVELGTHDQLIKQNGLYKKLAKAADRKGGQH